MTSDIHVHGYLGLETTDSKTESTTELKQNLQEATSVSVTPHYVIKQQLPETSENNQAILFSLLGISLLLIFLIIILNRKRKNPSR